LHELQRERDHLLVLHEALADVERASSLEARLSIFVEAMRRVGFGRVALTLRDADLRPLTIVATGLSADELRRLHAAAAPDAVWRQRLATIERFRISNSYYLDSADPEHASALAGKDPGAPLAGTEASWAPSDALLVPVRRVGGEVIATLLLDDPLDRTRPSITRVRTAELFAQQVAATLERTWLEALAARRARRLQKLQEMGALLVRSLDEGTILRTLAEELESILSLSLVAVFSTTTDGAVWARVCRDQGGERDTGSVPSDLADLARAAAGSRKPAIEPGRIAVPITLAGSVLGVIVVETLVAAEQQQDDVELLRTVGAQVASAVSNARIYAESQRQRRQMEALADVARAVSESLRLEQVLRLILGHATALLRTDGACISMLRGDSLEIVAAVGTGDPLIGMWIPVVGSMTGRAVRTGTSIVTDAAVDPEAYPPTVRAACIRHVIIVPLATAQGPVGALNVFNGSAPFTDDAAEVLQRLADQVAVAVVNARLFEDVTASRAIAERHQRVVETSTDAIMITDLDRRVAFANPAAITFFGHGDELIGMPASRTVPEEAREAVRRHEDEALAGEPQRYESHALLADGERRTVAVTTAPLREQGAVTGIVASLRDVTEERRARDAVGQSEARYRNLFESASDAIYTLDRRGIFTSVNEATVAVVGYPRTQLLGRNSRKLFDDGGELTLVVEQFGRALAGESARYECHFLRADGERRLVSVTNTPIRHGTEIVGVLGVARDVSDERARAAALARSEARYTRLVESASDAIFMMDETGQFTAVNRSLEDAVGIGREELLGTPLAQLIDARDVAAAEQLLRQTFAGERCRGALRYRAADGSVRHGSVISAPVFEEGVIVGALGIMRDVTDDQRLAEQLLQQEKLAAIGQLVSGVAHELNNPLAGVMAFSELLLASDAAHDADARHAMETIHREAMRAAKIVSHLLTFARQRAAERMAADLNAIVTDTLELRRYALRTAQIDLEVVLDPAMPRTWADPFQLQQVVLNLVSNAEQALTDWPGARRIIVWTQRVENKLVVAVSDTGPGIPPDRRDRIFNPFYTTKTVGQGTGLGLSISDGIVREHGGQIRVESHPGEGATFLVELPLVAPDEGRDPAAAIAGRDASPPRRMLVVDDESAMRTAISAFLATLGHRVTAATGGLEARALLDTNEYDVVLLDLRMPDLGGDILFEELRDRDPRHARRVVFVTGDVQSDDARRFLARTGRPVVSKPFQLDELATVLAGVTL
jgi:PAS domain S-box-containing protein